MNANELRIGNYVSYGKRNSTGKIIMFLGTSTLQLDEAPFLGYEEDFYDEDVSAINPILMTEEWHNNFGITKDGFNSFRYVLKNNLNLFITIIFTGDYIMLKQSSDDLIGIWNKDLTKRDMYVHEFQNLYFALTGTEL